MRYPFTDRWNSFWHFLFGVLTVYFPFIITPFLIYQGIQGKPNDLIDVFEFMLGFVSMATLIKLSDRYFKK
jgi:mannitol-specific phosphotransferase system IIBC component